ncbi:MAG: DUF6488 family protein [Gammaproteobacteria bacterium]|nr:DUF6488 family protein [Gammaproteobacteria bacterium]
MKSLVTALLLASLAVLAPAFAGPGHEHEHGHSHSHKPVSADQAKQKAAARIAQLVEKGKLDTSWAKLDPVSAEKKQYNGKTEWVVTYKNSKATDPAKQNLYVFFTLGGKYLATNHSGK